MFPFVTLLNEKVYKASSVPTSGGKWTLYACKIPSLYIVMRTKLIFMGFQCIVDCNVYQTRAYINCTAV